MNVIYLIIDSLSYDRLTKIDKIFKKDSFINSLEKKGITFTNMYSQAPYTEAAAQAMYCGQKTMDFGGHLYRFKDSKWTIFEQAKKRNMTTFYSNVLLQLYTSSTKRGVDCYFYNNGFELDGLWNYRLSYYKELLDKNALDDYDYTVLMNIMDENFHEWIHFFESLALGQNETLLLKSEYYEYDVKKNFELLKNESNNYKANKKEYINDLLKQGRNHSLFRVKTYSQNKKISDEYKKKIWKDNKKIIRSLKRKQFFSNLPYFLFNTNSFYETKKVIKHSGIKGIKTYLGSEYLFLMPNLLKKKHFLKYDAYKVAPSIEKFISSFCDWKKSIDGQNYFACIHVDDIHHTETFFTYDTECDDDIKFDFIEAKKLSKKIKKGYCGPLLYDLGIYYVGRKIQKLFDFIKNQGELSNTLFVITSDHGFSYQGTPTREKNISTFYKENYHIPAIFYYEGIKHCAIENYCNSFEIPNIIYNIIDGKEYVPKSEYASIEFMGSGCPDLRRRPIKLAIHDKEVMVCGDYKLNERASKDNCCIYDLRYDPQQNKELDYESACNDQELTEKINCFIRLINERIETIGEGFEK